MRENDEIYMARALELARLAAVLGEAPIGAVIVRRGEIIAEAGNTRETRKSATGHAEISAIEAACAALGGWRLTFCTLYVTLEPCPMCAGAIINARIPRVVIGARDPKAGAMGSVLDLAAFPLNHKPEVEFGVLEEECAEVLRSFFRELRKK